MSNPNTCISINPPLLFQRMPWPTISSQCRTLIVENRSNWVVVLVGLDSYARARYMQCWLSSALVRSPSLSSALLRSPLLSSDLLRSPPLSSAPLYCTLCLALFSCPVPLCCAVLCPAHPVCYCRQVQLIKDSVLQIWDVKPEVPWNEESHTSYTLKILV